MVFFFPKKLGYYKLSICQVWSQYAEIGRQFYINSTCRTETEQQLSISMATKLTHAQAKQT